jgi:hypothetical protein
MRREIFSVDVSQAVTARAEEFTEIGFSKKLNESGFLTVSIESRM